MLIGAATLDRLCLGFVQILKSLGEKATRSRIAQIGKKVLRVCGLKVS
jgi:hypothetical protein